MFGECGHGGSSTAIEIEIDPMLSRAKNGFEARVSGMAGILPRQF
jgi:hypothetical protein